MQNHRNNIAQGVAISIIAFLLVFGYAIGQASGEDARISGEVTDGSGAAVPAASIEVKRMNCKCGDCPDDKDCKCCPDRVVNSDSSGRFLIEIPAGQYSVKATAEGFQSSAVYTVNVRAGEQQTVTCVVTK